jgi:RNA polymerase sigma-70 factor, ECF subfamily
MTDTGSQGPLPFDPLVRQCLEGDSSAQRALFNKYKRVFFSLAYKSLGPGFDIDEVVHEIFIQLFHGLPSFQNKSSFDTWAYRIGINVCVSRLRKKLKKRQLITISDSLLTEGSTPQSNKENPQVVMEQRELENKIYEALDRLDEKKRLVLVLHDMEDKTLDDIAKILKKPVGTVKSRLFHGRNEMKNLLEKYMRSGS